MMDNPFTTSTVDDPASYNRLITGRVDDLNTLLTHIAQGRSVALVGERRIGKTSVLILLKDILNGTIEQYRSKLIDLTLQNSIDTLKAKLTIPHKAIYIDLQSLKKPEQEELANVLHNTLQSEGVLSSQFCYKTVIEVLQAVQNTPGHERFVILLDEMECLQDFSDAKQLSRNLRSISQKYPRICMILAGADSWHRQVKDNASRLANNIQCIYLKAASRFPIETYLVKEQLSCCFSSTSDIDNVVQIVTDWTGCKPYYVQAVCTEIFDKYHNHLRLPHDWKPIIEESVFQSTSLTLEYFYQGSNLDTQTKDILALLANQPEQTIKQIATRLGYSVKAVSNKVRDMLRLDKITNRDMKYHVLGTLIEKWGEENLDVPSHISSWPQRLKWVLAIVLFALAIGAYTYTNPELKISSFSVPGSTVYVQMPGSLEEGESGTATVWVKNTGKKNINTIHIFLSSSIIDYQLNGTNQLTFSNLAAEEKKSLALTYVVDPSNSTQISSQVIVDLGTNNTPSKYTFLIPKRFAPFQKYWFAFTTLFTASSLFLSGKDLWQLVINLLNFFRGEDEPLSKDGKQD
jgi:hypothetical protein